MKSSSERGPRPPREPAPVTLAYTSVLPLANTQTRGRNSIHCLKRRSNRSLQQAGSARAQIGTCRVSTWPGALAVSTFSTGMESKNDKRHLCEQLVPEEGGDVGLHHSGWLCLGQSGQVTHVGQETCPPRSCTYGVFSAALCVHSQRLMGSHITV